MVPSELGIGSFQGRISVGLRLLDTIPVRYFSTIELVPPDSRVSPGRDSLGNTFRAVVVLRGVLRLGHCVGLLMADVLLVMMRLFARR